ncbi:hypothetical protein PITCH_A500005 [uncultured Desulfobacterium sp.]|uniref:Uncharacterized protein n=1 Tax=uncultured Desulfobacterium sp. TaxID=201089 RepID=A0A445N0Y2_9BACT|nr:hypothetical protein PITCH_A500005 [uncultured Desulfobacterium sp.]
MKPRTAAPYLAQENPPEEPHDDEDVMLPAPWLCDDEKDENVDNSFSVLTSPHTGHLAYSSSRLRCRNSKT